MIVAVGSCHNGNNYEFCCIPRVNYQVPWLVFLPSVVPIHTLLVS